MNKFSSATFKIGLLRLPHPFILNHPAALDRWFYSLTPDERGVFVTYINELIESQDQTIQRKIRNNITRLSNTAIQGLGWVDVALQFGKVVIPAVTGAGVSIYQGKQQSKLQQRLSGQALGAQTKIAAMQAAAQKGIEEAKLLAQQEAARTAGTAQILTAQQAAEASITRTQFITKAILPIGLAAVAVGGLVLFMTMRKKRR